MSQSQDPLFDYLLTLGEEKVNMIGSRNLSLLGGMYGNDLERYKQIVQQILEMRENEMVVNLNFKTDSGDLAP
jgi:hypothetical protein